MDLTLGDVAMLWDYWADHPPLHELAAAYLGVKPREPQQQGNMGDLYRMFTGQEPPS